MSDFDFSWLKKQIDDAVSANQQQAGAGADNQQYRAANPIESGLGVLSDLGEKAANMFGFNEAFNENFHDDQGNFTLEKANLGNTVDTLGRFVGGLPGQVVGGFMMAPEKFYEAATGTNLADGYTDQSTGERFVNTRDLTAEQRLATAADAAIDVVPGFGANRIIGAAGRVLAGNAAKSAEKTAARKLAGTVGLGATEEAIEEFTQAELEAVRGNNEHWGVDYVAQNQDRILPRAIEGAALGALGGGIMGGAAHGLDYLNAKVEEKRQSFQGTTAEGASAPVTPYDYSSVAYQGGDGRTIKAAEQDLRKMLEENVESGSGTGKIWSDPKLKYSEAKVGMKVFQEIWNQPAPVAGGYTGSQILSSRFSGYEQWAASRSDVSIKTIAELFQQNVFNDQAKRLSELRNQVDCLNKFLAENKIDFVIGKNPHNKYGLCRFNLVGTDISNGIYTTGEATKALNSDHDGDAMQVYFDNGSPYVKDVRYAAGKLVDNLTGADRSGIYETFKVIRDKSVIEDGDFFVMNDPATNRPVNVKGLENAIATLLEMKYGISKESSKRIAGEWISTVYDYNEFKMSGNDSVVREKSKNKDLFDKDGIKVGLFLDKVLKEAEGIDRVSLVDDFYDLVRILNPANNPKETADFVVESSKKYAHEVAARMTSERSDGIEQSATLGTRHRVLADAIVELGKHLSFGEFESPAFFRQLQTFYQQCKGIMTDTNGVGIKESDLVKMWIQAFFHITKTNEMPADHVKTLMTAAIDAVVSDKLAETGGKIVDKASLDSMLDVFEKTYNDYVDIMEDVYKDEFSMKMPARISRTGENKLAFFQAFNRIYGSRSIGSMFEVATDYADLSITQIAELDVNDPGVAQLMFNESTWVSSFVNMVSNAIKGESTRMNSKIDGALEQTARGFKTLNNENDGSVPSSAWTPYSASLLSVIYKLLPTEAGLRTSIHDIDYVYSDEANPIAKAIRSGDADMTKRGFLAACIYNTYYTAFDIRTRYADSLSNENLKRVLATEILKNNQTPLHRVIASQTVKIDENNEIDFDFTLLDNLIDCTDNGLSWAVVLDGLERMTSAVYTGTPAIFDWACTTPYGHVEDNGMGTRFIEATSYLDKLHVYNVAANHRVLTTIDNAIKNGTITDEEAMSRLVRRKARMAKQVADDGLANLMLESTGVGKESAAKGTQEPYGTSAWAMFQLLGNGSHSTTFSQITNRPFGGVSMAEWTSNPSLIVNLVLGNIEEVRIVDDNASGEYVTVNRESILAEHGYKGGSVSWNVLRSFLDANPNLIPMFGDLDLKVTPIGETRVSWAMSKNMADAILDEKETPQDSEIERVKNEMFFEFLDNGNNMVLLAGAARTGDNPTLGDMRRAINRVRDWLYDSYVYIATASSKDEENKRISEVLGKMAGRVADIPRLTREFAEYNVNDSSDEFELSVVMEAMLAAGRKAMGGKLDAEKIKFYGELKEIDYLITGNGGQSVGSVLDNNSKAFDKRIDDLADMMLNDIKSTVSGNSYIVPYLMSVSKCMSGFEVTGNDLIPTYIKDYYNAVLKELDRVIDGIDDGTIVSENPEGAISVLLLAKERFQNKLDGFANSINPVKGGDLLQLVNPNADLLQAGLMSVLGPKDSVLHVYNDTFEMREYDDIVERSDVDEFNRIVEEAGEAYGWSEKDINGFKYDPVGQSTVREFSHHARMFNANVSQHFFMKAFMDVNVNADPGWICETVKTINRLDDMFHGHGNNYLDQMRKLTAPGANRISLSDKVSCPTLGIDLYDPRNMFIANKMILSADTGNVGIQVSDDSQQNRYNAGVGALAADLVCDGAVGEPVTVTADMIDSYKDPGKWYSDDNGATWHQLNTVSAQGLIGKNVLVEDYRTHQCTCPGCKLSSIGPMSSASSKFNPLRSIVQNMSDACEPIALKAKSHLERANRLSFQIMLDSSKKDDRTFVTGGRIATAEELRAAMAKWRNVAYDVFYKNFSSVEFKGNLGFGENESRVLANSLNFVFDIAYKDGTHGKITMSQIMKSGGDLSSFHAVDETTGAPKEVAEYQVVPMTISQLGAIILNGCRSEMSKTSSDKFDFEAAARNELETLEHWNPESLDVKDMLGRIQPLGEMTFNKRSFSWNESPTTKMNTILGKFDGLRERSERLGKSNIQALDPDEAKKRRQQFSELFNVGDVESSRLLSGHVFGNNSGEVKVFISDRSDNDTCLYYAGNVVVNFCTDKYGIDEAVKFIKDNSYGNTLAVPFDLYDEVREKGLVQYGWQWNDKNGVQWVFVRPDNSDIVNGNYNEIGRGAQYIDNFEKNAKLFIIDDNLIAPGDSQFYAILHKVNDQITNWTETLTRHEEQKLKAKTDNVGGDVVSKLAVKSEIKDLLGDVRFDSLSIDQLVEVLKEKGIELDAYQKSSNISQKDAAAAIRSFFFNIDNVSDSGKLVGDTVAKSCIALIKSKSVRGGSQRWTPVLYDGKATNATVNDIIVDGVGTGNFLVGYTYTLNVIDESGAHKIYLQLSNKGSLSVLPDEYVGRVPMVDGRMPDGIGSEVAYESREKDMEDDNVRNLLYAKMRCDGGSIFFDLLKQPDGTIKLQWKNEVLNTPELWERGSEGQPGHPTERLVKLVKGQWNGGWDQYLASEPKYLFSMAEDTESERILHLNQAVRHVMMRGRSKALPWTHYLVSNIDLVTDEHGGLVLDENGNPTYLKKTQFGEDTLVYTNIMANIDLFSLYNQMNSKWCLESPYAYSNSVDADKVWIRPDGKIRCDDGVYRSAIWQIPNLWDEHGEITHASAGANMAMQKIIKSALEDGMTPETFEKINEYNSVFTGRASIAMRGRAARQSALTDTIVESGIDEKEFSVYSTPLKSMYKNMNARALKHAIALKSLDLSFRPGNDMRIVDSDGIDVKDWRAEIQGSVDSLNKKLGMARNKGLTPDFVVNCLYKMSIGYTNGSNSDSQVFFVNDIKDAISDMIRNLDSDKLLIRANVKQSAGKFGDRYSMPFFHAEWARYIYNNSSLLNSSYKDFNEFYQHMYDEYDNKTRKQIANIRDYGKRASLLSLADLVSQMSENPEHYSSKTGYLVGSSHFADFEKADDDLIRILGTVEGIDYDMLRKQFDDAHRIQQEQIDRISKRGSIDRSEYSGMNVFTNMNDETFIKVLREASSFSKTMSLMNYLIPASTITERAVVSTSQRGILALSRKLKVGPFASSNKEYSNTLDKVAVLAKTAKNDKTFISTWAAIRHLEMNGDLDRALVLANQTNKTLLQVIADMDNGKGRIEKVQETIQDIVSGKNLMASAQIENYVNMFATLIAQEAELGNPAAQLLMSNGESGQPMICEYLESGNPSKFFFETVSYNSPVHRLSSVAMQWSKRADMAQRSAIGEVYSEICRHHSAFEFLMTTNVCKFVHYTTNMTERVLNWVLPMSSIRYAYTSLFSEGGPLAGVAVPFANGVTFKELRLEDTQFHNSIRAALMADAAHMGLGALAMCLVACSGVLEPPEDDDKWGNADEWTVFGYRVKENWWLSDIIGPSLAIACSMKAAMLGRPNTSTLVNKLGQSLYGNPMLKTSSLVAELFDPYESAASKYYDDQDRFGKTLQGQDVSPLEAAASDAAIYGMNWLGNLVTPSVVKELYRDMQQYETSYKKVYKVDKYGQPVYNEDGTRATEYTTYMDAKIRRLTRNNPVWAFFMNTVTGGGANGTGYFADEMPRTVYFDPDQIESVKTFSLYNEDGTEKTDQEKDAIALTVISMLQGESVDSLRKKGFCLSYDTMRYTGDVIWNVIQGETDLYQKFVEAGGLDYYTMGGENYELGKMNADEAKAAYDADMSYWKDFYNNVLWSDEMKEGIAAYNRFNVEYAEDDNGNVYATGFSRNPLLPIQIAQGDRNGYESATTGPEGDWATMSSATGQPMFDSNGNPMRALVPVNETYETPKLGSNSNSSAGTGYGYSRSGSYGSRSGGYSGGSRSSSFSNRNYNPANMRTGSISDGTKVYAPNLDYLKPDFKTKGSRSAYRRSDY